MDIIISMRKCWADMIFNGEKPFEFRNFNPLNFSLDDNIFIYESKANGGSGKVVGYFKTDSILDLESGFVERYFLPYFCKYILKDEESAKQFELASKISLTNYTAGVAILFALDKNAVEFMEKNNDWPPFEITNAADRFKTENIISLCDEWLTKIGFFNSCGETNYKKSIRIINPIKFDEPISLDKFQNVEGEKISRAPQSWQYIR